MQGIREERMTAGGLLGRREGKWTWINSEEHQRSETAMLNQGKGKPSKSKKEGPGTLGGTEIKNDHKTNVKRGDEEQKRKRNTAAELKKKK